ncbi:MAG: hypothetical protein JST79_08585 [Acidobacteria bacterium]|jgi:hypothetical protein|nr:hypothetical protein [Acidobacteriota bacterium]
MPQLAPIQIAVINASTVLAESEIPPVVAALQQQVTHDFRPAWGIDAELTLVPAGSEPARGAWWLSLLDDSDQAGALGYHDLTLDGQPLGKVFAATDLKYGDAWSVTASHELLEMLADPNINRTVFCQKAPGAGTLYAYEVADACQADAFGYKIGDVLVSDFVFPAWFEDFRAEGSTQFDRENHIHKPFGLLEGGYIGAYEVNSGSGWHQVTPERIPASVTIRGNVGSRRERRATPRYQWLPSKPHREIMRQAKLYRSRLEKILERKIAA